MKKYIILMLVLNILPLVSHAYTNTQVVIMDNIIATEGDITDLYNYVDIEILQQDIERFYLQNSLSNRINSLEAEDTAVRGELALVEAAILDIVTNYFPTPISNYVATLNAENNLERNILRADHNNRMDVIETARVAGDAQNSFDISTETAERFAADTTLQSNIDDEEAARIAADTTLQSNIDDEEAARIAADNALQTIIDAETMFRINAEDALSNRVNTETTNRINSITAEILARITADAEETAARIQGDYDLSEDVYNSMAALSNAFFNEYSATLESDFAGYASNLFDSALSSLPSQINPNNLITLRMTNETDNVEQWLYAEDVHGESIDIVITNGSSLKIGEHRVLTDSDYQNIISLLSSEVSQLLTAISILQNQIQTLETTINQEASARIDQINEIELSMAQSANYQNYARVIFYNNLSNSLSNVDAAMQDDIDSSLEQISALQVAVNDLQTTQLNSTNNMSIEAAQSMMKDLRVGSQIFDVNNGNATIRMMLDESSDLTDTWSNTSHILEVDIPADSETKFFRFRMD